MITQWIFIAMSSAARSRFDLGTSYFQQKRGKNFAAKQSSCLHLEPRNMRHFVQPRRTRCTTDCHVGFMVSYHPLSTGKRSRSLFTERGLYYKRNWRTLNAFDLCAPISHGNKPQIQHNRGQNVPCLASSHHPVLLPTAPAISPFFYS